MRSKVRQEVVARCKLYSDEATYKRPWWKVKSKDISPVTAVRSEEDLILAGLANNIPIVWSSDSDRGKGTGGEYLWLISIMKTWVEKGYPDILDDHGISVWEDSNGWIYFTAGCTQNIHITKWLRNDK